MAREKQLALRTWLPNLLLWPASATSWAHPTVLAPTATAQCCALLQQVLLVGPRMVLLVASLVMVGSRSLHWRPRGSFHWQKLEQLATRLQRPEKQAALEN